MGKRILPVKSNPKPRQLPPPGPETCIACRALKSLGIQDFNNIPGNCPAQPQNNFWCSLLHRNE